MLALLSMCERCCFVEDWLDLAHIASGGRTQTEEWTLWGDGFWQNFQKSIFINVFQTWEEVLQKILNHSLEICRNRPDNSRQGDSNTGWVVNEAIFKVIASAQCKTSELRSNSVNVLFSSKCSWGLPCDNLQCNASPVHILQWSPPSPHPTWLGLSQGASSSQGAVLVRVSLPEPKLRGPTSTLLTPALGTSTSKEVALRLEGASILWLLPPEGGSLVSSWNRVDQSNSPLTSVAVTWHCSSCPRLCVSLTQTHLALWAVLQDVSKSNEERYLPWSVTGPGLPVGQRFRLSHAASPPGCKLSSCLSVPKG